MPSSEPGVELEALTSAMGHQGAEEQEGWGQQTSCQERRGASSQRGRGDRVEPFVNGQDVVGEDADSEFARSGRQRLGKPQLLLALGRLDAQRDRPRPRRAVATRVGIEVDQGNRRYGQISRLERHQSLAVGAIASELRSGALDRALWLVVVDLERRQSREYRLSDHLNVAAPLDGQAKSGGFADLEVLLADARLQREVADQAGESSRRRRKRFDFDGDLSASEYLSLGRRIA